MNAVVNGLLWFGMFAIPMLIAVVLRRLGRKYGVGDRGDPAQEPDYRRWAWVAGQPSATARAHSPAGVGIAQGRSAVGDDARLLAG